MGTVVKHINSSSKMKPKKNPRQINCKVRLALFWSELVWAIHKAVMPKPKTPTLEMILRIFNVLAR